MRAVIIVAGRSPALQQLSSTIPASLLPCIDRPVLQHIVEFLVDQGIDHFDFVLNEAPERVEKLLGDGQRWGSEFTFHLVQNAGQPYLPLKLIQVPGVQPEPILLVHADRLPMLSDRTTLAQEAAENRLYYWRTKDESPEAEAWSGWAWIDSQTASGIPANATEHELEQHLCNMAVRRHSSTLRNLLDFRTFDSTMQAQRSMLTNSDANFHLGAREVESGTWIARNVVIHPTAHLTPPLFIGENSRIGAGAKIGPNAVVGHDSIVDKRTRVVDSAVYPGSYCGEGLELDHVIVDRNRLFDGRLGAVVNVTDSFILSSLKGPRREKKQWLRSALSCFLGALLFLLTLPLLLVTAMALAIFRKGPVVYHERIVRIPASEDPGSWQDFDLWSFRNPDHPGTNRLWRWILFDFLPALPRVVKGDLRLIGVQPRTRQELESTPADWKALCLKGHAGLITEAFVLHGASATEDEIYSSEVYYSAMTSLTHDLSLALRFVARV